MPYAEITGWGKCMPPAILTNKDLATFIETSDEWIHSRTGMRERRISHVTVDELGYVAAERALACAGLEAEDIDGILFGTTTPTKLAPNCASYVQKKLGNSSAAAMDINSACCSFLFSLSNATALIRNNMMKRVLVIGAERLSWALDWKNRNVSVLFGDGAGAVVVEATEEPLGVLSSKMGCYGDARETLAIENFGSGSDRTLDSYAHITWNFDGQEIFKRATRGMVTATEEALQQANVTKEEVDVVVPHQANLRIIEAVAKRLETPMEKVMVNVDRYANTSAATIPVALCEAVEEGLIQPGNGVALPAFGAGLTWGAAYLRWGNRVTPKRLSDVQLPENSKTALEIIEPYLSIANKFHRE
ncbi:ketoacyl-ACP synthase III [Pleionea sediminis]|uniref:ketoacyl-ACP synthase III n=1 Tax=Pleionea sediminis TaxID=2569479 RepID=UPI0011870647|nr:ketoacyl-ACP synthase III [Pleionea sediminis]